MSSKTRVPKSLLASTALLGVVGSAPDCWADVYKFVDNDGRIHLTDRPTHSGYRMLVKTWKGWEEQPAARVDTRNFSSNRRRYAPLANSVAAQYGLPPDLVNAVVLTESAYDPSAISRAGAVGLMQLMPATAARYGVSDRTDPASNLRAGTAYLRDLLNMFNNDITLALAAYNAGENAVIRYGHQVPPYKETQRYVQKVLQAYRKDRAG